MSEQEKKRVRFVQTGPGMTGYYEVMPAEDEKKKPRPVVIGMKPAYLTGRKRPADTEQRSK